MSINTEILLQALQIALIGMSLVFIGLLLLWGLMEITVQLTAWYNRRHPEEEKEGEGEAPAVAAEAPAAVEPPVPSALKQKAAAAAVALALALEESAAVEMAVSHSNGYSVQPSAWQAVMRSAQLNQRSNQFTRRPRGSAR